MITIIVLLILAMVTISMLTGPNGLLNKAVESKIENAHGEVRERLQLETNVYLSEKLEKKYTGDLLTYLQEQGFVEETNKVIMEKLMNGQELVTGKGTEETDIYKIEEKTSEIGNATEIASTNPVKIAASGNSNVKEYSINYYDESGGKREIGLLIDNGNLSSSEGNSNKKMINFTIDGKSYQVLNGTTWEEWVLSDNNDLGCWCEKNTPFPDVILPQDDYIYSSDTQEDVSFSRGQFLVFLSWQDIVWFG